MMPCCNPSEVCCVLALQMDLLSQCCDMHFWTALNWHPAAWVHDADMALLGIIVIHVTHSDGYTDTMCGDAARVLWSFLQIL